MLYLRQTKEKEGGPVVHINVNRVYGKMAEKRYTNTSLSKFLGINRNTLASYFKEPQRMPYDVMASVLCDSPSEAVEIFFDHNLRLT